MTGPILARMPVLVVLRAALVILGFLALVPAQAGLASPHANLAGCACQARAGFSAGDRAASHAPAVSPSNAQASPDDGYLPLPAVLPVLTGGRADSPPMPRPVAPEPPAARRLDRPPKAT